MIYLNLIAWAFALYLVSLFVRAIVIPYYKSWKHKRTGKAYEKEEKKLLKKGLRPFFFEHGKVKVFAHTQEQANAKYKTMKKQLKDKRNGVLRQAKK